MLKYALIGIYSFIILACIILAIATQIGIMMAAWKYVMS